MSDYDYDRHYSAHKGAAFDTLERRLFASAGRGVVVDLGCGTGRITEAVARTAEHVFALDIDRGF
jgi:predicted RNA methylase